MPRNKQVRILDWDNDVKVEVKEELEEEEEENESIEIRKATSTSASAREKRRLYDQRRNATPQQREKKRLAKARKRKLETEEERQLRLEKTREARRKKSLEETPEQRQARNEQHRERKRFTLMMRRMNMSEEKREEVKKKAFFYRQATKEKRSWANLGVDEKERRKQVFQDWKNSLSGEKKERHLESVARAVKKQQKKQYEKMKKDPEKLKKFQEKTAAYQRKQYAKETPEKRLKRRYKDKVNLRKAKMRKVLKEEGFSPEDVEAQVQEIGERMWREFYPDGVIPPPGKKGPPRKTSIGAPPTRVPRVAASTPNPVDSTTLHEEDAAPVDVKPPIWPPSLLNGSPPPSPPLEWGDETSCVSSPSPPDVSPHPSPQRKIFKEERDLDALSNEVHPCVHCPSTFSAAADLRSHLQSCHSEKRWNCPKCQAVVFSPGELANHYESVHKSGPLPKREEKVPKKESTDRSGTRNFVCVKCPAHLLKHFQTRDDLFSHVKCHHSGHFWPCQDCHLLKYSERSLSLHRSVCTAALARK